MSKSAKPKRLLLILSTFLILFSVFAEKDSLEAVDSMARIGDDSVKTDLIPPVEEWGKGLNVLILEFNGTVDPRMDRYCRLGLARAEREDYDMVIIDMNTYGGGVLEADSIRTRILNFEKPIWVFINGNAGSAGSLISIACDSIFMAPGSSFGASTVVNQDGSVVPEKYQSFMRSKMRATAEAKGRDPKIAEGMVGLYLQTDSAKVIAYTPSEAIANDYCEGQYGSLDEMMSGEGLSQAEVAVHELDAVENIIAFFLNPAVKSILMLLILGGLYFEFQSPGVGFPGIAALLGVILYFVPDYLHGLLASWELLLFIIGVALLLVEVFVIPGFGVVGISGAVLIFSALLLSMLNNDAFDFSYTSGELVKNAVVVLCVGIFGSALLLFFGSQQLVKSRFFKKVALQASITESAVHISDASKGALLGKEGVSYTVLRPSGKVNIDGEIIDAFTRGEYIEKGEVIKVIDESGVTLQVKKVQK